MNSLHYFDKSYVPVSRIETTRVAVVLVAESKATTYLKNKFLTQSLLSTTPLMQYKKHFEVRLRMFEFFFLRINLLFESFEDCALQNFRSSLSYDPVREWIVPIVSACYHASEFSIGFWYSIRFSNSYCQHFQFSNGVKVVNAARSSYNWFTS